jgi:ATP-dependent helicase/nuclease subunit B
MRLPMTAMARHTIESTEDPLHAWERIVERAFAWAHDERVALRDVIVLVPFAQLLPAARRAWARVGGWLPRIETTQTLVRALTAGVPPVAGQIAFHVAVDRLSAAALLRTQTWARGWERADPRHFEQAVASLVDVAHAVARAAAAVPPSQRAAYWDAASARFSMSQGPAMAEAALARIAVEWAASGAPPDSDALFDLRPSAWIVVQAGGIDALAEALLGEARQRCPTLLIDTDADAAHPFAGAAAAAGLCIAVCDSFEDEAQRSAAHVLALLRAGTSPVALVAQDRSLVRRVRALLARNGVPLHDETGWKLSTTRAAAQLMAFLLAMRERASSNELLDWLKAGAGNEPAFDAGRDALVGFETACRRYRWSVVRVVDPTRFAPTAARLWEKVTDLRAAFAAPARRPLGAWLACLRDGLAASGDAASLRADNAGAQVLAALRIDLPHAGADEWQAAAETTMQFDAFLAWVDTVLEHANFLPADDAVPAQVVITPLQRAMLRPFAAIVFPGADEKRLGHGGSPLPLISDADAAALGLPDAGRRRLQETLAFAQLLRVPSLTLLRRHRDGGEPLAASPLLERLRLAMQQAGQTSPVDALEMRERVEVPSRPLQRPSPAAAALLPERLSASAVEALRACPYRFFALEMLRLREHDELDDEVEKRDYGDWLHAVLHEFHASRERPLGRDAEIERLRAIGARFRESMAIDEAAFLPFDATFERFAGRYVDWLQARDADGARWIEGEIALEARPQALGATLLRGRIDRIDRVPGEQAPVVQLIDYKTGSAQQLRQRLRQPGEDTQLAFYAALVLERDGAAQDVQAAYLALDESDAIRLLPHHDVASTAHDLVQGLAHDLERLRNGAGLPALGEADVCSYCAARGLCRRDDWTAP